MYRWTTIAVAISVLPLLVGCSSTKTKTIQQQEAKIRSLSNENNMLVDQNRQLASERDLYQAKFESSQHAGETRAQTEMALRQVISAKDKQIAYAQQQAQLNAQRAASAEAKYGKAMATRSKPPVVVAYGGGSNSGGAATGALGSKPGATGARSGGGKYHLRIISLPGDARHQKIVQEMASFLRSKGIQDVNPRRSGRFWVIDIGNFASIRSSQAVALKNKVRGLSYRGVKQFRSAYFAEY